MTDAQAWRSDAQAFYVEAYNGVAVERNLYKFEAAERIWRWNGGEGCLFADRGKTCPDDGLMTCQECAQ